MLIGQLALMAASIFAGVAFYINVAEHPARMRLDAAPALRQWQPSYKRAYVMQASLVVIGSALAIWAYVLSSEWRWLLGGAVLLANLPWTLLLMLPLNNRMMSIDPGSASAETMRMLGRWNALHTVRTMLGAAAAVIFLWTLTGFDGKGI